LKSTYKRHGTLNLFAALEVSTGKVKTKFTEYKKREDFRSFLDDVLAGQPQSKEIHVILDNYSSHKGNGDGLAKFKGRVQFHFTPTSASWLNQIEIVFSLLQRKTLNGASFKTKDQLRDAIEAFIQRHNERAKPFRWRKREVKGSQLKNCAGVEGAALCSCDAGRRRTEGAHKLTGRGAPAGIAVLAAEQAVQGTLAKEMAYNPKRPLDWKPIYATLFLYDPNSDHFRPH
jgi:transposase